MGFTATEASPHISVIIVSYNTAEKTLRCLKHLQQCAIAHRLEVIVVDNGSADESVSSIREHFPNVLLIISEINLGFGRANNLGAQQAKGELLLFLNSDCYCEPDAIEILAGVFENPSIVAAGGKLINPDGSLQESVTRMMNPWFVFIEQLMLEPVLRKLNLGYWITRSLSPRTWSVVPQVMGACLMMRSSINERFDPRFFLYCEDTELCYRLNSHGKIVYEPRAIFVHELGASSTDHRWKSIKRYNRGKVLFHKIHFGKFVAGIIFLFNLVGTLLRILVSAPLSFQTSHRTKMQTFWKVLVAKLEQ